ncbi:leucine-rich repeat protein [Butyrivibrio sp. WCD2001]|uniref:leucine-rich repeat protein n=1 Tax=Butyrivibrio sp. WCD2001 TaxID=1280681 RepID=UPI000417ACDE|nr:leucine-rich repeat protein [Butyrivibrio sp. WCD2001]
MKKNGLKKFNAMALAVTIMIASIALTPVMDVNAATSFTMEGNDDSGNPYSATFVANDTVNYHHIDDAICPVHEVVIDGVDKCPGSWEAAKQHLQSGYDDLYSYVPRISLYDSDYVGRCNGTLTLPIPAGHTKADAFEAKIICNYPMGTESYFDVVEPSEVTDKTVSFKTYLGNVDFGSGSIELVSEIFIEYKTHTHTWDEGTETKKATYTEDGVKTFKCKVCGETKTEPIPKLTVSDEPVKDEKSAAEYNLTIASDGTAEATFVKPTNKKAKKYTVPEEVTLPDGSTAKVTQIGPKAFKDCGAKQITIPKSVNKISAKAFEGSSAKKIIIKTDKKAKVSIGKGAFKKMKAKNTTIQIKGCSGKPKANLVKTIKKQASKGTTVK